MPLGGGVSATILLVTSIIGAGATTASAVSTIKDKNIRRAYEQNLASFNQSQKDALEKEMQKAKTTEERHAILAQVLGTGTQARIEAIKNQQAQTQKTINTLLIIGGVGVAVLIVGLIIYKSKRK